MVDVSSDLRRRKVAGAKVFASDYRPTDLADEGWPPECAHALLLRCAVTDRLFRGMHLERLSEKLRPHRSVTQDDIKNPPFRNRITTPDVEALLPVDEPADYVGQPVAVLIYSDFLNYRRAAQELREDGGLVSYGEPVDGPLPSGSQESTDVLDDWISHVVKGAQGHRLVASNPGKQRHYLLDTDGGSRYSYWLCGRLEFEDGQFRDDGGPAKAQRAFAAVDGELATGGEHQVEVTTFTQQVDPAFLEPEAGLGWLDRKTGTLHLLLGTQSPAQDWKDVSQLLGVGKPDSLVREVAIIGTDCGGGFGGRDKSPFPIYLALAAVFCDRPVRLAFDRREQFQGGLKRHASAVRTTVRADAEGRLTAVRSFVALQGGVEANLNTAVLGLAALHATGPYRVRGASVHGIVVEESRPPVGSMRGFGIPQVAFAIETAIDRLAVRGFNADPIEFRLSNVLKVGDVDVAGTPLRFHLPNVELCAAALEHELWRNREARRASAYGGTLYGVGFACCMQAYGTTRDSVYAAIQLEPGGAVSVWSPVVDMGQGARRSLQAATEQFFGTPALVHLGVTAPFERLAAELEQVGQHAPLKIDLSHGASSASKTAFFHVHVLREACEALLELRLIPAARTILGQSDLSAETLCKSWRDGAFRLPGKRAIALPELTAELHRSGRSGCALAHGYFANGWSSATFVEDGARRRGWIDALAFCTSPDGCFALVPVDGSISVPERGGPDGTLVPPRSAYASGGHLIGVELDQERRHIRVVDAVTFLDAGDPIVPDVLAGQVEGGLAMGLGHTLHEELPVETGTGPFTNFDRYQLTRAADMLGVRQDRWDVPLPEVGALAEGQPKIRHKGIGEITMTTVAPAVANAIAHALGHQEHSWPTRTPIRFADLQFPDCQRSS
jgi:CO/xanthine dehydrogenase Mo-binding subunit